MEFQKHGGQEWKIKKFKSGPMVPVHVAVKPLHPFPFSSPLYKSWPAPATGLRWPLPSSSPTVLFLSLSLFDPITVVLWSSISNQLTKTYVNPWDSKDADEQLSSWGWSACWRWQRVKVRGRATVSWWRAAFLLPTHRSISMTKCLWRPPCHNSTLCSLWNCPDHRHAFHCRKDKFFQLIRAKWSLILR